MLYIWSLRSVVYIVLKKKNNKALGGFSRFLFISSLSLSPFSFPFSEETKTCIERNLKKALLSALALVLSHVFCI